MLATRPVPKISWRSGGDQDVPRPEERHGKEVKEVRVVLGSTGWTPSRRASWKGVERVQVRGIGGP